MQINQSNYSKNFALSSSRKVLRIFHKYCLDAASYSPNALRTISINCGLDASTKIEQIEKDLLIGLMENKFTANSVLEAIIHFYMLAENLPLNNLLLEFLSICNSRFSQFNNIYFELYKRISDNTSFLGPVVPDESDFIFIDNGYKEELIVGFSGMARKSLGLPWNTFNDYYAKYAKANLLVLRDNFSSHYRLGIESLGSGSFAQSTLRLNEFISNNGFKKVVFVGSSAGSYGALMFSIFVKCSAVVCLSGRVNSIESENSRSSEYFLAEKCIKSDFIHRELSIKSSLDDCKYYYACGRFSEKDYQASCELKDLINGLNIEYFDTDKHAFLGSDLDDCRIRTLISNLLK